MVWYWAILSVPLPSKKAAYEFRRIMYRENGIKRHKMIVAKVYDGKHVGWRVFRKIHEFELADLKLGNEDTIAQYRRYLKRETRKANHWLTKGRRK